MTFPYWVVGILAIIALLALGWAMKRRKRKPWKNNIDLALPDSDAEPEFTGTRPRRNIVKAFPMDRVTETPAAEE